MKGLSPSSQGDSNKTKATQYFDLSIQNLQLAIYHGKMGLYNTDKGVPDVLRPMVEECYKIACLMALHNPPLLLDFNNCGQGPFPPIKTKRPCAAEEVAEKFTDPTVFIAIDLGTAFSGYCFRIAGSEQVWEPKWGEEYGFDTPKTPTCILFDENEKFVKFGYDAEMAYTRQTQKDKAKNQYLFENFKQELYGKELHRDVMLTAKNGKQMKAMKVFSESLRFIKDHALEMIGKHTSGVKQCTWILTVPAIASAAAKQFMREAATEAGLVTESEPEKLIIALETEAASVCCKQLPHDGIKERNPKGSEKIEVVPGTKYMVVDCGGVINITVHEVVECGHLKELYWASEKHMAHQTVGKIFRSFLREHFPKKVFDEFEEKHPSELQRLMYDYSGDEKCLYHLQELVRKVEDNVACSRESAEMKQRRILQIEEKLKSLHDESLRTIESLIKETLINCNMNISYIFLVGGFAQSLYVNRLLKEKFGGWCKVLCPVDAQMAVLRGAVTFGMIPNAIQSWISRFTHRFAIAQVFDETKHKGKYKHVTEHGEYCGIFLVCPVEKNTCVHFGKFEEYEFCPLEKDQKQSQFHFYYNNNETTEFVQGMKKIGCLSYTVPNTNSSSPHLLKLQIKFGCPEMQMTVRDVNSGETVSVKLNFMPK